MSKPTSIPSICPKCGSSFDAYSVYGPKKFCSRKCSNSRGPRTEEFKKIISAKLKGKPSPTKGKPSSRKKLKPGKICPVCQQIYYTSRVTCSRECFKVRATENALKQEKHGGGHKGIYKGFKCDSTYELAFIIWHLDHDISITRCYNVYNYTYKGKVCKYQPDFVVEGIEIEIKGFMCQRAQAKLADNPHVFLIDKVMMQPYLRYVRNKYKIKDLRLLYETHDYQQPCLHCHTLYTPGYKKQKFCSNRCGIEYRVIQRKKMEGDAGSAPATF